WPTAEAACSSSIAVGLTGIPIMRMPMAIAPEVTSTGEWPAVRSAATCLQISASTGARTSPRSSATSVEPSFTTQVDIWARLLRLGHARVERERHLTDLDLVAGLEPFRLELADDPQRAKALLDVLERIV